MAATKQKTERRTMRADENLVLQVIKRQAGTLSKAALEGAMNSVDAGATEIKISLTSTHLTIEDDGKGFESAASIRELFEVFGKPHELDEGGISTDAKYGTFRIGRGQLFAFGKNNWRTNKFEMVTDVNEWGLSYDLKSGLSKLPGCVVYVELYESLSFRDIQHTKDEIMKFCRYMPQNVTVNGDCISQDPAKMKWDLETDDAYINMKPNEHAWGAGTGLSVYQQGVFVETIQARTYGLEGTIVIKEAVAVNFARNQVIRSCKRWQKIAKFLKTTGEEQVVTKTRLNRHEAAAALQSYVSGEGHPWEVFTTLKCLPDTNGKMWSIDQILKLVHTRAKTPPIRRTPQGLIRLDFARKGSRTADKALQLRKVLVLDEVLIDQVGLRDESNELSRLLLLDILSGKGVPQIGLSGPSLFNPGGYFGGRVTLCDHEVEVEAETSSDFRIIPPDELTPTEANVLNAMDTFRWGVGRRADSDGSNGGRHFLLGDSPIANGWTDGKSFIAISRQYLSQLNMGLERDWHALSRLVCHEYAHKDVDTETHEHTPEFYEDFHDLVSDVHDDTRRCFIAYRSRNVLKAGKNVTTKRELHKEAEAYVAHALQEAEEMLKPPKAEVQS